VASNVNRGEGKQLELARIDVFERAHTDLADRLDLLRTGNRTRHTLDGAIRPSTPLATQASYTEHGLTDGLRGWQATLIECSGNA
jgi:hypothetical protein